MAAQYRCMLNSGGFEKELKDFVSFMFVQSASVMEVAACAGLQYFFLLMLILYCFILIGFNCGRWSS